MPQQEFQVNSEENIFIERCPHDQENPYTMIKNDLIRDMSISPECRWLIIYLLSNKPGWRINIAQVISHVKPHMGKDKVYSLFTEAIEAGYIRREISRRKNPNGGILKGYRYFVSESPKFKKFHRHPENQEAGDQYTGFTDSKNNHPEEGTSKEITNTPISPQSSAANAESVCVSPSLENSKKQKENKAVLIPKTCSEPVKNVIDRMIKILADHNQGYRPPKDMAIFQEDVREMLEDEKREVDDVIAAFEWAASDFELRDQFKGWGGVIARNKVRRNGKQVNTSPAGQLREHFGSIVPQMKARAKRTFAPSSNDARGLSDLETWAKGAL